MAKPEELIRIRKKLTKQRTEIIDRHQEIHVTRTRLSEPDPEPEEKAQKEDISEVLDHLDDREKNEVLEMDKALSKIDAGSYGVCESCGRNIPISRLLSVPWSPFCRRCEKVEEKKPPSEASEPQVSRPANLPPDYEGLSDEEILRLLDDTFRVDDRVETDELQIECHEGVITLRGFLPSEAKRSILLQIIHDTLGFQDVVDEILIDPLLWERRDRSPGERPVSEEDEVAMASKVASSPKEEAEADDVPVTPPDELIPENEG